MSDRTKDDWVPWEQIYQQQPAHQLGRLVEEDRATGFLSQSVLNDLALKPAVIDHLAIMVERVADAKDGAIDYINGVDAAGRFTGSRVMLAVDAAVIVEQAMREATAANARIMALLLHASRQLDIRPRLAQRAAAAHETLRQANRDLWEPYVERELRDAMDISQAMINSGNDAKLSEGALERLATTVVRAAAGERLAMARTDPGSGQTTTTWWPIVVPPPGSKGLADEVAEVNDRMLVLLEAGAERTDLHASVTTQIALASQVLRDANAVLRLAPDDHVAHETLWLANRDLLEPFVERELGRALATPDAGTTLSEGAVERLAAMVAKAAAGERPFVTQIDGRGRATGLTWSPHLPAGPGGEASAEHAVADNDRGLALLDAASTRTDLPPDLAMQASLAAQVLRDANAVLRPAPENRTLAFPVITPQMAAAGRVLSFDDYLTLISRGIDHLESGVRNSVIRQASDLTAANGFTARSVSDRLGGSVDLADEWVNNWVGEHSAATLISHALSLADPSASATPGSSLAPIPTGPGVVVVEASSAWRVTVAAAGDTFGPAGVAVQPLIDFGAEPAVGETLLLDIEGGLHQMTGLRSNFSIVPDDILVYGDGHLPSGEAKRVDARSDEEIALRDIDISRWYTAQAGLYAGGEYSVKIGSDIEGFYASINWENDDHENWRAGRALAWHGPFTSEDGAKTWAAEEVSTRFHPHLLAATLAVLPMPPAAEDAPEDDQGMSPPGR